MLVAVYGRNETVHLALRASQGVDADSTDKFDRM